MTSSSEPVRRRRHDDWEDRLAAELARWHGEAHSAHEGSCGRFVADCVKAATGADLHRGFGRYRSAASAARALKQAGFSSLEEAITSRLGAPVPVAQAQRGDVVMHAGCAGIVVGVQALFLGSDGLERRPLLACDLAWPV